MEFPELDRCTAVVTGASSGIGVGIARVFAEAGAEVVITCNSGETRAAEVVRDITSRGGTARSEQLDVNNPEAVRELFRRIGSEGRSLKFLVNNAGVYPVTPLKELGEEEWNRVVRTNLDSTYRCTRWFAQHAEVELGIQPAVVNIASIEAEIPSPGHAHYGASKAAVVAFTKSAAVEYGPQMRVNAVSPGLVGRPKIDEEIPEIAERYRSASPVSAIGDPEDIGHAVLFLCSPWAKWITGHNLVVDGGIGAVMHW